MTSTLNAALASALQTLVDAHGTSAVLAEMSTLVRSHVASVAALQGQLRTSERRPARAPSAANGERSAPVRTPDSLRAALKKIPDAKLQERVYYEVVLRTNRNAVHAGHEPMAAVADAMDAWAPKHAARFTTTEDIEAYRAALDEARRLAYQAAAPHPFDEPATAGTEGRPEAGPTGTLSTPVFDSDRDDAPAERRIETELPPVVVSGATAWIAGPVADVGETEPSEDVEERDYREGQEARRAEDERLAAICAQHGHDWSESDTCACCGAASPLDPVEPVALVPTDEPKKAAKPRKATRKTAAKPAPKAAAKRAASKRPARKSSR
jgi:hypothetical protein